MTFFKAVILIPVFFSGFWLSGFCFAETSPAIQNITTASAHAFVSRSPHVTHPSRDQRIAHPQRVAQRTASEVAELNRRIRIEQILMTLDRVAEVTGQMSPERAVALEPVLVDLAEQTLELTSEEAVRSASTDEELDEIEGTVAKLVGVVENMIEPEMSL